MPVSRKRPLSASAERVLHPTKGFRKVSLKRGRAAFVVQAIKSGTGSADLATVRQFIATGV